MQIKRKTFVVTLGKLTSRMFKHPSTVEHGSGKHLLLPIGTENCRNSNIIQGLSMVGVKFVTALGTENCRSLNIHKA